MFLDGIFTDLEQTESGAFLSLFYEYVDPDLDPDPLIFSPKSTFWIILNDIFGGTQQL
jgi:hypothetical protein